MKRIDDYKARYVMIYLHHEENLYLLGLKCLSGSQITYVITFKLFHTISSLVRLMKVEKTDFQHAYTKYIEKPIWEPKANNK